MSATDAAIEFKVRVKEMIAIPSVSEPDTVITGNSQSSTMILGTEH